MSITSVLLNGHNLHWWPCLVAKRSCVTWINRSQRLYVFTFNPKNILLRKKDITIPVLQMRNQGTERWSVLPRVTQWVIQSQGSIPGWFDSRADCSFHCSHENSFRPRGLSGSRVSPDVLIDEVAGMEEPGRLQSMRSLRVGHDWPTSLSLFTLCVGEGNGNPLQYSCLENPRDGGAWWAAMYGVAQSPTQLKWLSSSCNKAPEFGWLK